MLPQNKHQELEKVSISESEDTPQDLLYTEVPYMDKDLHPMETIFRIFFKNTSKTFIVNVLIVGQQGCGKTTTATLFTEDIISYWGEDNTEAWIWDRDYRITKYKAVNLANASAAREELIEQIKNCKKPYFVIQLSDVQDFLDNSAYVDKKKKVEIDKFIRFLLGIRHQNPNIKGFYLIIGAQNFKMVAKDMRRTFTLIILKAAAPWIIDDVIQIYPQLTPDQVKWLGIFNEQVMFNYEFQLGILMLRDLVEVSFDLPEELMDLNAIPQEKGKGEGELIEEEESNEPITDTRFIDYYAVIIKGISTTDWANARKRDPSVISHHIKIVKTKLSKFDKLLEDTLKKLVCMHS